MHIYFNVITFYKVAESTKVAFLCYWHGDGLTIRNGKMNPKMVNPSQRGKPVNTNAAGR